MPRRRLAYRAPRDWLVDGEWPDGVFAADAPGAVDYAAAISARLADALAGRSKSQVAAAAGLERSTLYDIVNGATWPEVITLAGLERALDATLWPVAPVPVRRAE